MDEVVAGEKISVAEKVADLNKRDDQVVEGARFVIKDRAAEIAEVKAHAEELQKSAEGSHISAEMINKGTLPPPVRDFEPSNQLKLYSIYCEPCGFKRLTDGSDVSGLIPYKQSPIPGGSPYRDPLTGEIRTPPAKNNSKKFKCPRCGRVVTVRKVADPNTVTGRSFDE
jgi:predicted RNA-binding Zn-ribbon protein involved in translation (DUF1610 family)